MFIVLFSLPLIAAAVYFIFSMFKYTRMIGNIFLSLVYQPVLDPLESSHGGEIATVLDSSGHEIEVLCNGPKHSEKIAIFCPESGASKEYWEKYAYFLPAMGWTVLSIDLNFKTAGEEKNSLVQWPTDRDVQRVVTVIRWAKRAYPRAGSFVLFGVSKGADVALAAANEESSIKAVVADGLFSMKEIFRDYIRKWGPILVKPNIFGEHYPGWVVDLFANLGFWHSQRQTSCHFVDVEKLLKDKKTPIFLIHGAEDDYIPAKHQAFLSKIVTGDGAYKKLTVPNARHNEAVIQARNDYERQISDFLKAFE